MWPRRLAFTLVKKIFHPAAAIHVELRRTGTKTVTVINLRRTPAFSESNLSCRVKCVMRPRSDLRREFLTGCNLNEVHGGVTSTSKSYGGCYRCKKLFPSGGKPFYRAEMTWHYQTSPLLPRGIMFMRRKDAS